MAPATTGLFVTGSVQQIDGLTVMRRLSAVDEGSSAAAVQRIAATSPKEKPAQKNVVRHVLAPLDGSSLAEEALGYVVAVAKGSGARVTLLRVLESTGPRQPIDALEWELARRDAQAYMARIQGELAAVGVDVQTEVVDGRASEQMLHFAVTTGVDLIVITTHGEGGGGRWSLSGTVHKVIAGTSSSVLVVPAWRRPAATLDLRLRKIVVGLDCSPRAECTVALAVALAQAHDAELLLVHAVPEPELPRRLSPSSREVELARQVTEANHREARRYLRELQGRLALDGPRLQAHTVVSSHAAKALRELAAEAQADLIIVAAHGATGDATTPYGSVAASLLADASHPVVIVQDLCRDSARADENEPSLGDSAPPRADRE